MYSLDPLLVWCEAAAEDLPLTLCWLVGDRCHEAGLAVR
jgi:hypothetical protein